MERSIKISTGYMTFTALVGIILGVVMLFYPGGTMKLMGAAFWVFQLILSIFILYYTLTEAAHHFRIGRGWSGVGYILLGILGTLFIWILDVGIIYFIVALFLILSGLGEIIGSFQITGGSFFLTLLGTVSIIVGILIISNPIILPLLIAWYVLFWGISRLFLSLELRRMLSR